MPRGDPLVRFDDVPAGRSFVLTGMNASWSAAELDDVAPLIREAQRQSRAGCWVAVMLTYEAGAAFDPAMPKRAPDPATPLAWFGAFDSREKCEPLTPPTVPVVLSDVSRLGGSDWFEQGVMRCRELITEGLAYQINLTDRFRTQLGSNPFDLYRAMTAAQAGSFNAYLDLGRSIVVSASPELFLQIDGDTVIARPMKGTARRHPRPGGDRQAVEALVASEKERAENVMIVDLLRNDLSRLARPGGVSVPALFTAERYETVWQLTSTVRAELRHRADLAEVLAATFPCGSVTGAPKIAAMGAIDELEPWPRGVYCGTIGVIEPARDARHLDHVRATFSVAIRTAVVDRTSGVVTFGVGGGVTWGSDPAGEDAEVASKAAVLTTHRPDFELLETLRVVDALPRHLDAHLRRLAASADYFGFRCDVAAIHAACTRAIEHEPAERDRRMRILLARPGSVRVELHPLVADSEQPVRLALAPHAVRSDDVFCCHKTTYRQAYERAAGRHHSADDVICGNERGEATEACRANLLFRRGGQWFTPPLASGGLAGIARQQLIDQGRIREQTVTLDNLANVDDVAVVSSLRGIRMATLTW